MYCHCCGAPATTSKMGRSLRFWFCEECAGARYVPDGTVELELEYNGRPYTKRERTFVLVCPVHGKRDPLDVDGIDWHKAKPHYKSAYPVKTRDGKRVMVLDYTERS